MNREAIQARIAALEARGLIDADDRARLEAYLRKEDWPALEVFLNQLELEARLRSWRPIVRLAMLSSLISAIILIAVAMWVATKHPEIIKGLQEQTHEQGQSSAGN